jgi:hypothetical protein
MNRGAKAHQSHEVATHSNVISAKFFDGDKRVISGHIHLNGMIDYSSRARSGAAGSNLTWRTNEQTGVAEWWDGTKWVAGEYSDEYQKWHAYHNGQWYYR